MLTQDNGAAPRNDIATLQRSAVDSCWAGSLRQVCVRHGSCMTASDSSHQSGSFAHHSCNSVSAWINGAKDDPSGDDFVRLWQRYMNQVVHIATTQLSRSLRRLVDGDDIANEVFVELSRGLQDGRFARLVDRHDLWQILVMLTERRARHWWRHEGQSKRGGGLVIAHELPSADGQEEQPFSQVADQGPTPRDAALLADMLQNFLNALPDELFRRIAIDWLTGYTQPEIAARQGIGLGSVERKLRLVRLHLDSLKAEETP